MCTPAVRRLSSLVAAGLVVAAPLVGAIARADVIYQTTDPGGPLGYWGPDVSSSQSVGVRFTPAQDYAFDTAQLWFMNNDFSGQMHPVVRVTIRPDQTSVPGQSFPSDVVIEQMFITVTAVGWSPVLETAASIVHPRLCAGRNYWIVAESNAPGGQDGVWVMAGNSTGFSANTDQGHWQPGGMGAVPGTRVYGTPLVRGDVNADGACNADDVPRFVAALLGTPVNPADTARADVNCDGLANGRDVQVFVNAVLGH